MPKEVGQSSYITTTLLPWLSAFLLCTLVAILKFLAQRQCSLTPLFKDPHAKPAKIWTPLSPFPVLRNRTLQIVQADAAGSLDSTHESLETEGFAGSSDLAESATGKNIKSNLAPEVKSEQLAAHSEAHHLDTAREDEAEEGPLLTVESMPIKIPYIDMVSGPGGEAQEVIHAKGTASGTPHGSVRQSISTQPRGANGSREGDADQYTVYDAQEGVTELASHRAEAATVSTGSRSALDGAAELPQNQAQTVESGTGRKSPMPHIEHSLTKASKKEEGDREERRVPEIQLDEASPWTEGETDHDPPLLAGAKLTLQSDNNAETERDAEAYEQAVLSCLEGTGQLLTFKQETSPQGSAISEKIPSEPQESHIAAEQSTDVHKEGLTALDKSMSSKEMAGSAPSGAGYGGNRGIAATEIAGDSEEPCMEASWVNEDGQHSAPSAPHSADGRSDDEANSKEVRGPTVDAERAAKRMPTESDVDEKQPPEGAVSASAESLPDPDRRVMETVKVHIMETPRGQDHSIKLIYAASADENQASQADMTAFVNKVDHLPEPYQVQRNFSDQHSEVSQDEDAQEGTAQDSSNVDEEIGGEGDDKMSSSQKRVTFHMPSRSNTEF